MSSTPNPHKHIQHAAIFLGSMLLMAVPQAVAEPLISTTINAGDVFDGPALTLTRNLPSTARLDIRGSGVVDLYSPELIPGAPGLQMNAAGVLVAPTTGLGGIPTGGIRYNIDSQKPDPDGPSGALVIGNANLGFVPLFANCDTGIGSSEPPVELMAVRDVGELFGTSLDAGTTLQLRVNDINTLDNLGAFHVAISVVPEPGSIVLCLIGAAIPLFGSRLFLRNCLVSRKLSR